MHTVQFFWRVVQRAALIVLLFFAIPLVLFLLFIYIQIYYGEENLPNGYVADGVMFVNYVPYDRGYVAIREGEHGNVVVPGPVAFFNWDKDGVYGEYERGTKQPYFFYSETDKVLRRFSQQSDLNNHLKTRGFKEYDWGSSYNIGHLQHKNSEELYRKIMQKEVAP